MDFPEPAKDRHGKYSISSLRLDVESAKAGKTWVLLPDGFRNQEGGINYPLPTRPGELQTLVAIDIPPGKVDPGIRYLKRALKRWKERQRTRNSALLDSGRRAHKVKLAQDDYQQLVRETKAEIRETLESVKVEAADAVATLTDLFSLGRKGLREQMEAYLADEPLRGAKISHRDFRQCYQMIAQTVKALGLPDPEKKNAKGAVMEQYAESLRATQDAVSLAAEPADDDETKH